jgi:hypothetical protein
MDAFVISELHAADKAALGTERRRRKESTFLQKAFVLQRCCNSLNSSAANPELAHSNF